jgi:hypothetical protein
MDNWPTGWRFWLLIALLFVFPVVLHPWWLFLLSAAIYVLLIRVAVGTRKTSRPLPKRVSRG